MTGTMEGDEFQNAILHSVGQHTAPYPVKLKGRDFVMFPDTYNPNYAKASLLLLDNLGVQEGDIVLDPFTGCGADAIFAVLQGAARAVAIDRCTMPYLCARYNVHRLGLEDRVEVRQGDSFAVLQPDEKFDLVVANPPFRRMEAHTPLEEAIRDADYAVLQRFFATVSSHLKPQGRIRLVFSDVGDIDFMKMLATENGFAVQTIAATTYAAHVRVEVYEMT